jgi:hypothetical protein
MGGTVNHIIPAPVGPWRLLVLDKDPDDPRWLIATIALPEDVRPARLDMTGRYTDWLEVTAWVAARLDQTIGLAPMNDALAWIIRPARPRGDRP